MIEESVDVGVSMKVFPPTFSVIYLMLSVGSLAASDPSYPVYPWQVSPECALIWQKGEESKGRLLCLEDAEIVSEGEGGLVTFGTKVGDKVTKNEREIKHVPMVPDQLRDLVLWLQSCGSRSACDIEDELSDVFSILQLIDLEDGAWRYQLSRSRTEPSLGTLIYFFDAGEVLIAFRIISNFAQFRDDVGIYPFFVAKKAKN